MNKDATIQFIRKIAVQEFPDNDLDTYDLFAEDCYEQASNGNGIEELSKATGGHHEFSGETLSKILEALSLLSGTVLTFITLKEKLGNGKKKFDGLKATWELDLIKSGISPDLAHTIVEKYHEDLQKVMA